MQRPSTLRPVSLQLRSSRAWCTLVLLSYGGAAIALALLDIPLPMTVLVSVPFLVWARTDIHEQGTRHSPAAIVGLRSLPQAGRWHLLLGSGHQLLSRPPEVHLSHPWLVILSFPVSSRRKRLVVIQKDAVDAVAFRRLRLHLARR